MLLGKIHTKNAKERIDGKYKSTKQNMSYVQENKCTVKLVLTSHNKNCTAYLLFYQRNRPNVNNAKITNNNKYNNNDNNSNNNNNNNNNKIRDKIIQLKYIYI